MTAILRTRPMTQEEFFAWAEGQEARYEFDGEGPVAMTGGTRTHGLLFGNLYTALRSRLRGSGCQTLGPDAGIETVGKAVRYPDVLVTCTPGLGRDRLIPGVVAVFEVLSPASGRTDRIDKLREYRAVPSIRRYVILEYTTTALTVFERAGGAADWTATVLTEEDTLRMPEIGIEVPVAELYEGVPLG